MKTWWLLGLIFVSTFGVTCFLQFQSTSRKKSVSKRRSSSSDGEEAPSVQATKAKKLPRIKTKLAGPEIYQRALKSTVWITNPGVAWGSGVLVDDHERLVVTNYHVVYRNNTYVQKRRLAVYQQQLSRYDTRDRTLNLPYRLFHFNFLRGRIYLIEMNSRQFDCYLQINNMRGQMVASDDDSGGNRNASVLFFPPHDRRFSIMATTYAGGTGNFTLRISRVSFGKSGASVAKTLFVDFPDFVDGKVIAEKRHYVRARRKCYGAQVVAWDEAKDLAILRLDSLPDDAEPIPLATTSVQPGQSVHSVAGLPRWLGVNKLTPCFQAWFLI